MKIKSFVAIAVVLACQSVIAAQVNCSEAYEAPATCERVACDEKYQAFIGTWSGPFKAYSRELSTSEKSVYRNFQNTVSYSEDDCLKNVDSGDEFIIGRRTDVYAAIANLPAKTEIGLLINGKKKDGSPFLRTVDSNGLNDYKLVYHNKPAKLSIWNLTIPASANSPEMSFTTIDNQDFSVCTEHKRIVTVTMTVGPASKPIWQGIVTQGHHTLTK